MSTSEATTYDGRGYCWCSAAIASKAVAPVEISSSTSTSGTSVPGASGVNSAASVGSMKWVVACECPSSNVAVTLTPPAHRRVECR